MLAESITKERKEILVREKAQQKVCLFKKKEKMNTKIYTQEAHEISIISFISTVHVIDT